MIINGGVLKGSILHDQGPVTTGLVEYLDASDYSGSGTAWPARVGNSATLRGTTLPSYTSGTGYFTFDPSNLQFADAPTLGDLGTWTVECWYNLTTTIEAYNDPALVTTEYQTGDHSITYGRVNFALTQQAGSGYTNTLCAGYYTGPFPGGWYTTSPFTPVAGQWAQMVGTSDGTNVNCYLNSSLISQVAGGGAGSSGGGPLRIARRWDGDDTSPVFYMPASIAVVRIYNFAFSPNQVTQNFNYERRRFSL